MRVLLEGPYGNHHPIAAYDHILLVAGGSGITALLPYVFSLTASPRSIRSITIVWAVRNAAYAANVLSHELAPKCTQHVNLEVFVTREQGARPFDVVNALEPGVDATVVRPNPDTTMPEEAEGSRSDSRDATMAGETEKHDHDHDHDHESDRASGEKHSAAARLTSGRPSMPGLLRQSIDRLVGAERLAVLACGPASMMDDLRQAVASSYGTGEGQVRGDALEYFEDAFTW
jgi:NAD(P)H-flavin reductase